MSGRSWFYASEGKQQGPLHEIQLRELIGRGAITADTLVWTEGMANWQQAGDIPGLFSGTGGSPVILPVQAQAAHGGQGTRREIVFKATGLEFLWRSLVTLIACLFIIPIPWVLRWLIRWQVSQLVLVERGAHAKA